VPVLPSRNSLLSNVVIARMLSVLQFCYGAIEGESGTRLTDELQQTYHKLQVVSESSFTLLYCCFLLLPRFLSLLEVKLQGSCCCDGDAPCKLSRLHLQQQSLTPLNHAIATILVHFVPLEIEVFPIYTPILSISTPPTPSHASDSVASKHA
jgi:hypothetical protein